MWGCVLKEVIYNLVGKFKYWCISVRGYERKIIKMIGKFKLDANTALLVVIDLQEKLLAAMPENAIVRMEKVVETLWDGAVVLGIPILVTEQYPKGLGGTLPSLEERAAQAGIVKISKMAFSCCAENEFNTELEKAGRKKVILCGQESHVCVLQTALDLLEKGYEVFVAADAVCSRDAFHGQLALEEMRQAGCVVEPVESLLFKMLGKAGTEQFKAIARLIK